MSEVRMLANCVVGLGFSRSGFQAGLDLEPHMIGCDAGSADFGPYYLGADLDPKSRTAVKRDLAIMLDGALAKGVPLVIGSCGGAGAAAHVDGYVDVVTEIAREQGSKFRLARIDAEQPLDRVEEKLGAGRIRPLGPVPPLELNDVRGSVRVVAMMGVDPFLTALRGGAAVVLAGRAVDPGIFAATPLLSGMPDGVAWHAAKSIDKGYLATTEPSRGSPVMATVRSDHFVIAPTMPTERCTVRTVAAMTMHENPNPFEVAEPGGTIDTTAARYTQLDERSVRVDGSRFRPASRLTAKLEGVSHVGYRVILVAGVRDPRVLSRWDEFVGRYRELIDRLASSMGAAADDYTIELRSYGYDAVLGDLEPPCADPKEIGLIVDVVGRTEDIARSIGARLGPSGSRLDVTGRLGGGGNFAYPFSPSVIPVGPVYRWSAWHLMDLDRDEIDDVFPITYVDIDGSCS